MTTKMWIFNSNNNSMAKKSQRIKSPEGSSLLTKKSTMKKKNKKGKKRVRTETKGENIGGWVRNMGKG